ncbi:unnamed protein product [Paramecium pentaurelia]|uniref:Transmembrane protein n=1 Tax=Paramecium pentaurelia TaxID=43138 RepID=A0A8S1SNV1_9CILI|nr:unnamed protein product [Paramecium pentaurelia]
MEVCVKMRKKLNLIVVQDCFCLKNKKQFLPIYPIENIFFLLIRIFNRLMILIQVDELRMNLAKKIIEQCRDLNHSQIQIRENLFFIATHLFYESFGKLQVLRHKTLYIFKKGSHSLFLDYQTWYNRPYLFRVQLWKGSFKKFIHYMNNRQKKIANINIELDLILLYEKFMQPFIYQQQNIKGYINKQQRNNFSEKSKEAAVVKLDYRSLQIMTKCGIIFQCLKESEINSSKNYLYINNIKTSLSQQIEFIFIEKDILIIYYLIKMHRKKVFMNIQEIKLLNNLVF